MRKDLYSIQQQWYKNVLRHEFHTHDICEFKRSFTKSRKSHFVTDTNVAPQAVTDWEQKNRPGIFTGDNTRNFWRT